MSGRSTGSTDDRQDTVPNIDLPRLLRSVLVLGGDADALSFEGRWYTWGWLGEGVGALDDLLTDDRDGALVGVVMRNRPEIVRVIAASLASRRCLVTLSSAIPPDKLAAEVRRLHLPVVVATGSDWDDGVLAAAVADTGALGLVAGDGDVPFRVVVPPGRRSVDAEDTAPGVAVRMLTSGTTGPPKRIDLRYRSLEHEIESTAHYGSRAEIAEPRLSSGVSIVWNPLLHIGGLRGLMTALVAGRRVALLERFTVESWVDLVREHRPRVLSLVPTTLAMVLDADVPVDVFDGVDAVFSGTSPLDPELAAQFERRYGVPVLVVYGATEFAGGVAGWTITDRKRFGEDKRGSVGRPNRGVSVRVVDRDSGDELGRGEIGLLEVSGPQLVTPGWTRTTDMARMDDDDFIWIVGRADDVIVRGGFKVSTEDVRRVLLEHPAVLEACVIGLADRRLGQVPVAAVEVRRGTSGTTADELVAFARARLSGYQVPSEIKVVDALPRTPSMKVSQPEVRALFEGNADAP